MTDLAAACSTKGCAQKRGYQRRPGVTALERSSAAEVKLARQL